MDPKTQASPEPTAPTPAPEAPPEAKTVEEEVAALRAQEAAEASKPAAEGEGQPPAPEPKPTAWTEKDWERHIHSAGSAATFGKERPKLPDGISVDAAPEALRPVLEALGYGKAEGKEPEEPPEAAAAADPTALTQLTAELLEDDDDEYQGDREDRLEAAATAEERAKARQEAKQASADRLMEVGLELLEEAGYEVDGLESKALDRALAAIPGLILPTQASNRRQVARFLASVRLHVEAKTATEGQKTAVNLQGEIVKAREQWEKDLTSWSERQNGQERIGRGDLATAIGTGGAGEIIPSEEGMTPEELAELERKNPGIIDEMIARDRAK